MDTNSSLEKTILRDELPSGAGYGQPTWQFEAGASASGFSCTVVNDALRCTVLSGVLEIPVGGWFDVALPVHVSPGVSGTELRNPAPGSKCLVDDRGVGDGWVTESDESDNDCVDIVRVDRSTPTPTPSSTPTQCWAGSASTLLVGCDDASVPPGGPVDAAAVASWTFHALVAPGTTAHVCIALPADRNGETVYKVARGEWRELWPNDSVEGADIVRYDAEEGVLCVAVVDDGESDSDSRPGRVTDPLVLVSGQGGGADQPPRATPSPTEGVAGEMTPGPTPTGPTPRPPRAGQRPITSTSTGSWALAMFLLASVGAVTLVVTVRCFRR